MADITSIEPYEAVTVSDTTDETRTDLPALIQRMENQIALQNQVIRQFLEHWDSISQTHEVVIDNIEIAANNGQLVRTDIPMMPGYKPVGVVGMKIGMTLYTMYYGLESNNTKIRCDFLNRSNTPFSGSPGTATVLYIKQL